MQKLAQKILIVEDDAGFLALLVLALQEAGYLVQPATTLATALEWLRQMKPDLVITDLGLPDGKGMDLCRSLTKSPETMKIPVIILTGDTDNKPRIEAAFQNVCLYLNKPVGLPEVVQAVKGLIGAKGREKSRRGVLRRGNFEIDPAGRTVFYNGKTLKIPGEKMFDVLYILVEQSPRTISKRYILAAVAPKDRDKAVDVLIFRLRERVSSFFGCGFIETVPGEGYCFKLPAPFTSQRR